MLLDYTNVALGVLQGLEQVEQEYWSAMLLHCFPAIAEVTLKLTVASYTPFHLYDLHIVWCSRITLRTMTFINCYIYYYHLLSIAL